MKKLFLLTLIALIFVSCSPSTEFSFVFMTDIHLIDARNAEPGFAQAIQTVNELGADFVITGGDQIMDALAEQEPRADSLYALYKNAAKAFQMPVYNTIGNHEVFGLYEQSGVSPDHPKFGKKMFEEQIGPRYQSFDHKGWHFILLDDIGFTNDRHYFSEIDSVQIEWLKQDLQTIEKSTPIVVSVHIPFTSVYGQMMEGSNYGTSIGETLTNSVEVLQLFNDYNLKLVLQGHLHVVEEIVWMDTHFITGGAVSAAWWTGQRDGFEEGFVKIDVKDDDFTWQYVDYSWEVEKE